MTEKLIAKVISDLALDKTFDYLMPEELRGDIAVGSQVKVPFGRSERLGFVLRLSDHSEYPAHRLKSIIALSENRTRLTENLLKLGLWMAEYYCCSQEQAVRCLLPGAVRSGRIHTRKENFHYLADREGAERFIAENEGKKRFSTRVELLKNFLSDFEYSSSEFLEKFQKNTAVLAPLVKAGLIKTESRAVERGIFGSSELVASSPRPPTEEQAAVLNKFDAMLEQGGGVMLLHGVTNSGKTEVYMQAVEKVRRLGKGAIVLVPEISLTPQTVRRFRARFGDRLSVLHSALSDGERFDQWNKIDRGEADIVVGARSALFAPIHNLGLIVVDEEHESSYKQSETPRYHARDVAVVRGKIESAVVILGSATPSAESVENARSGKYTLCEMKNKVSCSVEPRVRIIDMRLCSAPAAAGGDSGAGGNTGNENTGPGRMGSIFSPLLIESVNDRLRRGEQSILFYNLRGYARTFGCELCQYEAHCPDCSVKLVYSRRNQTLNCHWCGHSETAPSKCPVCGNPEIRYSGSGTERIENIAAAVFPGARICRMDSDTMRRAEDYENALDDFRRGATDILIGTQMIAKGLHFPNVTLVGILNADQSLNQPDFRAAERTYQLITQVAGRAGRGDTPGEVLIQSYNPENEVISAAAKGDFEAFQQYDFEVRKILKYPPFSHLILLHFESENEQFAADYAMAVAENLKPYLNNDIKMAGPMPAPVERIKGKFRYQIVLRGENMRYLRRALRYMVLNTPEGGKVSFFIDVDAQDMR